MYKSQGSLTCHERQVSSDTLLSLIQHETMSSPFATPKKPATDALLHPPGSAVGIAIAAANEAQGKAGLDSVHAA